MGFEVFGVGVPEMIIILVVALIFLGPDKLPEAARTMGTWVREIRGLTTEAVSVWQETVQGSEEIRQAFNPQNLIAPSPPVSPTAMPLVVPYTPPAEHAGTNGDASAVLDYPAPFEGPAAPAPPQLDYPAPFGDVTPPSAN